LALSLDRNDSGFRDYAARVRKEATLYRRILLIPRSQSRVICADFIDSVALAPPSPVIIRVNARNLFRRGFSFHAARDNLSALFARLF
jgi:RNA:NAD 2'-phosphotransferase (TPT1/KptA family)